MKIKLPPQQNRWLMALASDELAWGKADVEKVRVPHREVLSVEEAITEVDAHMASLKR